MHFSRSSLKYNETCNQYSNDLWKALNGYSYILIPIKSIYK